ncbi:uncharacterized protein [Solanum lycopersicum]|uniref:uncharacterized protein n=1 Tax=Solanum lycopersicum TaxID=4081 RepID=UPI003749606C
MNAPMYIGSKVDEDPQDFLDEVYKILLAMRVSTTEKDNHSSYQLKDVAQACLIVHAQQVEESRIGNMNREAKGAKLFESGSSKSRLDVQDKPKLKKSCYGCGKGFHMVRDCTNVRIEGKGNSQDQQSGPSSEAPKRNHFHALKARGEQESSLDIVMGMLQVSSVYVYALLDKNEVITITGLYYANKV